MSSIEEIRPSHSEIIELTPEQKLVNFSHALPLDGEYQNRLFEIYFPEAERASIEFNPESLEFEGDMTEGQKKLRREILLGLGYESPRKQNGNPDTSNVEPLYVAFSTDRNTLTYSLNNELNSWTHINGIAQTDPRRTIAEGARDVEEGKVRFTRGMHAKHIGRMIAQTVLRLAILDPDLFLEKAEEDVAFYQDKLREYTDPENPDVTLTMLNSIENISKHSAFTKRFYRKTFEPSEQTTKLIDKAVTDNESLQLTSNQIKALAIGTEFAKYCMIYAYAHDGETPGFGDIFMRTKAKAPGQISSDHDEDKQLARKIFNILYTGTGGLSDIAVKHDLDPLLLGTMIRTASLGQDRGLMGLLMKDKGRKELGAGFDHDQLSGMLGAVSELAGKYLNGLRHKQRNEPSPILSLQARVELMMRMEATGMSKEDLQAFCTREHIDFQRLYIAEEELSIGRHLRLVRNENKNIVPACTNPGVTKRADFTSNVLEGAYYKRNQRAATEKLIQTMFACGLFDGVLNKHMFLDKTDTAVETNLREIAPVILYVLYDLQDQATILSKKELLQLAATGQLENCLIRPAEKIPIVQKRTAAVTRMENGEIRKSHAINDVKRDGTENPFSNRNKLTAAEKLIEEGEFYYCILVTSAQQKKMVKLIDDNQETARSMHRALAYWRQPLHVSIPIIMEGMDAEE